MKENGEFQFSAAEWAALFPSPVELAPSFDPPPPPREMPPPLGRADLLGGLPPLLRAAARYQIMLAPIAAYWPYLWAFLHTPIFGLLGAVYAFGGDEFGATQKAVAIATLSLSFTTALVFYFVSVLGRTHWMRFFGDADGPIPPTDDDAKVANGDVERAAPAPSPPPTGASFDRSDLAAVVRYGVLVRGHPESPLVSHRPNDPLCPCQRDSCAGPIVSVMGPVRLADMLYPAVLDIFTHFCAAWTALVTLASQTWTTWWSALFAAVFVGVAIPLYSLTVQPLVVGMGLPQMALQRRINNRAITLTLSSFLTGAEAVLSGGASLEPGNAEMPALDSSYATLHDGLTHEWMNRTLTLSRGRGGLVALLVAMFLNAVLYIVSSSCVPVWVLGALVQMLVNLARTLFVVAANNTSVEDAATSYALARSRLQRLLALADPAVLASPAVGPAMQHEKLLGSFADADRYRAKFLGFRVGSGTARGFVVTAFTVLVGSWTIARSLGVRIQMDNVCR